MSWGETNSAQLDGRGRKYSSVTDGQAFSKIGQRKNSGSDDCLTRKPAIVLDMGEASREQGFRLNGCR